MYRDTSGEAAQAESDADDKKTVNLRWIALWDTSPKHWPARRLYNMRNLKIRIFLNKIT